MYRFLAILILVLLWSMAHAGIYCDFDLLGEEVCGSSDGEDSARTGRVNPELAGTADYPRDESHFSAYTRWYVVRLLARARVAGAAQETLRGWADCLDHTWKVTDTKMACLRELMTFVTDKDP